MDRESEPVPGTPRSPLIEVMVVGDVAADVFVHLADDLVSYEHGHRALMLSLGAKIPVAAPVVVPAGGNAANVAVAAARLGVAAALVSYVGGDGTGREVLAGLHDQGVDTRFVRVEPEVPTNRNVVLWCRDDRTILVHHERYAYHWPHLRPREVPAWLYLTSLGAHAHEYHDQLADWLDEESGVRLALQPGTFQIAAGAQRLARLYRRAAVVLCNREEAAMIGGGDPGDAASLLSGVHALGAGVVVVTDGSAGAYASDGEHRFFVPSYPTAGAPLERTGAGDAFAATAVAALARGVPLEEALAWAPVNAASVVEHLGAQAGLLEEKALRARLEAAPPDYRVVPW